MEGIILIILSLIISQFFGNKKKETHQTPPPVSQKKVAEQRPSVLKELETWTRQLLEETEQKLPESTKRQIEKTGAELKERLPRSTSASSLSQQVNTASEKAQPIQSPVRPGRLSVHAGKPVERIKSEPVSEWFDTREELARAIVLSEIIAPPISKRK